MVLLTCRPYVLQIILNIPFDVRVRQVPRAYFLVFVALSFFYVPSFFLRGGFSCAAAILAAVFFLFLIAGCFLLPGVWCCCVPVALWYLVLLVVVTTAADGKHTYTHIICIPGTTVHDICTCSRRKYKDRSGSTSTRFCKNCFGFILNI